MLAWFGIGLFVLLSLFYVRLLFGPVSLDFLSDRVKSAVAGIVEDNYIVDWADFGLSLTGPLSLGFHLSTVTLTERTSDATITMEALEISVSPIGAALGRPDARVILVEPHIQMLQNLLGPRLSRFEFLEEEGTGETVVRVLEGERIAPNVRIGDDGISLGPRAGDAELDLRSDNDWLVLNVEALNDGLAQVASQAMSGQIRSVEIRDGTVGVLDMVYGLYKSFDQVGLEVRAGREDGRVAAIFSAHIAGQTMHGSLIRQATGAETRIEGRIDNIDFSTIIPFLDDAAGLAAIRGTGTLDLGVDFDGAGEVRSGNFVVDLSGTHLRLNNDEFDVRTGPIEVEWTPSQSRFSIDSVELALGESRGLLSGDIVMGFDEQFGPTLGMSFRASDVWLHPADVEAPAEPFDEISFEGWSAPLYGALGIDRMIAARQGVSVVMQGRVDMVRDGLGLDVRLAGRGASADDVKRLWPYLFAREGREWFIEYVQDGRIATADMHFNFPVGSINMEGGDGPVPEGSMTIDLVGEDVELVPFEGLPEFQVDGRTRLTMRDNQLTVAIDRARLPDFGEISISNAAYINQDTSAKAQIFEVSGDITGRADAVLRMANSEAVNLMEEVDFSVDLAEIANSIEGNVETTIIATIMTDDTGQLMSTDYALNGMMTELASTATIAGFDVSDAGFSFTASQEGFRVLGSGLVNDVDVDLQAIKARGGEPEILVGATLGAADAARFGVDLSEFIEGSVRVVARPAADGAFEISADLADTALTIRDIGITKSQGTAGALTASVTPRDDTVSVSDLSLAFGTVELRGDIAFSPQGQLLSANFPTFRVSPGDSARVSMTPIDGGYAFRIDGQQLDIKPVLKRFFNLEGDAAAGASDDLQDQLFAVSVKLDRALGYYGEAAFNVDLDLSLRGDQLRNLSLSTQFLGNKSASATTNPLSTGRVISYATNDLGAMLRFIGIYPRLVGGEGSMVMRYDQEAQADAGALEVRNFAIVDEDKLGAIVSEHDQSRDVVAGASALEFDYGRAEFVRYADRIQVLDAAIYGDLVGGTIRGNVLTAAGQYDLAGTYVPLFGLNNFFQQIPVLGPIFGGREGEGLLGVTFAVRGPLAQPDLLVNPVSILAPGVFRSLFEYRAANR